MFGLAHDFKMMINQKFNLDIDQFEQFLGETGHAESDRDLKWCDGLTSSGLKSDFID